MPTIFYDLYWLLVFCIVLLIGMILFFGVLTVTHRLYKNWYYRKSDQLRERFAPLVTNLRQGDPLPDELKGPLKSIERSLIEELLLNELGGVVSTLNRNILQAFEQLGYVEAYIGQLNHGNRWQQAAAAERLGQMRSSKAIEALTIALDQPDVNVQTAAVQAFGNIGGDAAAEPLTRKLYAMSESNPGISLRVLKSALINLGPKFLPYMQEGLHHEFWRVRGAVVDILSEIADPKCAPDLRPILSDPDQDVRAKAARALGRMKDATAVTPLIALLKDPSWIVRLQAARAVGRFSHADAMEPLLHLMRDENWQVRATAAEAIRRYGMRSIEFLSDAITNTPDRYAREQLFEEIQRSGLLETYVDALCETATDDAMKPHAIVSEYIHHGTVSLLIYLLTKHPNSTVRRRLLDLFAESKPPLALDAIQWLNNHDPDRQVRQSAEQILRGWMGTEHSLQETDAKSNQ